MRPPEPKGGYRTYKNEWAGSAYSCPLYPQKRTCAVQLGMSAMGQKRTSASFDRFMMRPVSGTKRSKHVARCLTGNLHQAGKRLTHFQDQKIALATDSPPMKNVTIAIRLGRTNSPKLAKITASQKMRMTRNGVGIASFD